jgi:hypothetical protein
MHAYERLVSRTRMRGSALSVPSVVGSADYWGNARGAPESADDGDALLVARGRDEHDLAGARIV